MMDERRAVSDGRPGGAPGRVDLLPRHRGHRPGRVLASLLGTLVVLALVVGVAGVVGVRNGWIEIAPGGGTRTASAAGEVGASAFAPRADSLAAVAPAAVPAP